jgi:2-octaprenyl-6-methoxyphenol hydroxylase
MHLSEPQFLLELGRAAGPGIERLTSASPRQRVPLSLRVRRRRAGQREVYVGNAAQTLHPVAGQGLNLGLRDAWDLADLLARSADPGDGRVLERYAASRRLDRFATITVTDALARLFVGAHPALGAARGIALSALELVPPARRFFARRMIFGASAIP